MKLKILLCLLCISLSSVAFALPQKWQLTFDLSQGQVILIDAIVVEGYPRPPSSDLSNLFYDNQGTTRQAEMLPYRVLDTQFQEVVRGEFPDTDVRFSCGPTFHNKRPLGGEMTIRPLDLAFLEIPYGINSRWIEVIRSGYVYTIDIVAFQSIYASSVTTPPVMIGSPQLIINNGPSSQKIDLVIIGDGWGNLPPGYPDSLDNYRGLVASIAPRIFAGGWFYNHASKFNVWRIDVDGSFGATPYSMWPSRLNDLYAIAGRVPFDQIMLIVKDSGSLSPLPRPRANLTDLFTMWDGPPDFYPTIADVTRHELGHTLGQMADEYGPFGSPAIIYYPAGPVRAAGNDVVWDNLTVWGRVGDLSTLQQKRPFWGRILGNNAVLNRPVQQQYLHHWFWDIGSFESGAMADRDIWHSSPTGAMCCGGAPWNSVPYNVMTKHTTRFVPTDAPLGGAVTLLSPASGAQFSGDRMTFRWQAVPGAKDYHLVIRRYLTGETFFSIPTHATEIEIYTAGLVRGEPHSWTVIAANNNSETPLNNWNIFAFVPNQPFRSACGDLDRDGILTLDDVDIVAAILYQGAWAQDFMCIAGDVDSDAALLHTKSFPNDFGDMEIIRYWALCNPTQNPQGCGTAPGHPAGHIPPLPTCTTPPGTYVANCSGRIFKCGDYNNDNQITIIDSLGIAQNAAGLISISPFDLNAFKKCAAADPSGNQSIDILDSLLVARSASGLDPNLTCPVLIPGPGGSLPAWCSQ